jgi:hypothetical protein
LKHNVSEAGFSLRRQVKPTQLAQSIEVVQISGKIVSDKNKKMDNIQKREIFIFQ